MKITQFAGGLIIAYAIFMLAIAVIAWLLSGIARTTEKYRENVKEARAITFAAVATLILGVSLYLLP